MAEVQAWHARDPTPATRFHISKIGSPRGSPPSAYQKKGSPRPRRDKRCPQHDSTYQKIGSPRIPLRQGGSPRVAFKLTWFFTIMSRLRHVTPPLLHLLKNRFAAQLAAIRLSKIGSPRPQRDKRHLRRHPAYQKIGSPRTHPRTHPVLTKHCFKLRDVMKWRCGMRHGNIFTLRFSGG